VLSRSDGRYDPLNGALPVAIAAPAASEKVVPEKLSPLPPTRSARSTVVPSGDMSLICRSWSYGCVRETWTVTSLILPLAG
jgi:hypothetical protein